MNFIENAERKRTDTSTHRGGKAAIKPTSLIQQPAGSRAGLWVGAASLASSVTSSHFPLLASYCSNRFVIIALKSGDTREQGKWEEEKRQRNVNRRLLAWERSRYIKIQREGAIPLLFAFLLLWHSLKRAAGQLKRLSLGMRLFRSLKNDITFKRRTLSSLLGEGSRRGLTESKCPFSARLCSGCRQNTDKGES